jgi:hypothetical protein
MTDVVLVSMPFGPLFSPSIGLSLLQPQVRARGFSCRVEYCTLPFAERIGHSLYFKIVSEKAAITRAFAGEWIFSHALYDWPSEKDRQYIADVLLKPPSWLKRNPTPRKSLAPLSASAPTASPRSTRASSASRACSSNIWRRWRSRAS